ncbi:hypothetical protein [Prosthecobacter sp.]|uniref:hypothetical protein n=1 Tax=Prosthecobacter sp. TaxID=1965333 RepID=UPI0037832436
MSLDDSKVVFPLLLAWEDGSQQLFANRAALECDLEDFDSEKELSCKMVDAEGYEVSIKISMTWLERLQRLRL